MSQIRNVEIPVRFAFLPFNSRWQKCDAEVIGWLEEPSTPRELFSDEVDAEFERMTIVRLNVPVAGEFEHLSSQGNSFQDSYEIEVLSTDLPPDVMRPHENRRNTPDIGGRKFQVLTCTIPELKDLLGQPKPGRLVKDAWRMREEFLGLKDDMETLCNFLNRWGQWDGERGYNIGFLGTPYGFKIVIPHWIWKRRDRSRSVLTGNPQNWLSSAGFPGLVRRIAKPPYFEIRHSYCESAIHATITLDLLSAARFGVCSLDTCQKIFERKTKQKRSYCSNKCAHCANMRERRKNERNRRPTRKGAGSHATRKG